MYTQVSSQLTKTSYVQGEPLNVVCTLLTKYIIIYIYIMYLFGVINMYVKYKKKLDLLRELQKLIYSRRRK